ncbi:MAG TPA: toxin-antitoxin system HicB family antitoxin [Pirellulaceae bacterium]|nr:toxin-antitoxin system HicB family antitoxin [Pirellulaceae bacterium]
MNEGKITEDKMTSSHRRFDLPSGGGQSTPAGAHSAHASVPSSATTHLFDLTREELEALPPAWRNLYESARDLYVQKLEWIRFFSAVLGPEGMVRQALKTDEEVAAFRESPAYAAIQQMVGVLRSHEGEINSKEPLKVITVRVPKSLHESLRHEAHRRRTSMNQLCILKLLQDVESAEFDRLAQSDLDVE